MNSTLLLIQKQNFCYYPRNSTSQLLTTKTRRILSHILQQDVTPFTARSNKQHGERRRIEVREMHRCLFEWFPKIEKKEQWCQNVAYRCIYFNFVRHGRWRNWKRKDHLYAE